MTGYLGGDILAWHEVMFVLHEHWKYSESDILDWIPYERDIKLMLIRRHLEKKKAEEAASAGVGPTYKMPHQA